MIQLWGPEGKGCLEGEFFYPLLFELPRHLFPEGTGFAESLFTVTDFSDSPLLDEALKLGEIPRWL
ncbi:hypothetical protein A7K91_06665 [Paenibacillus oryzae]|uniref:Uncharacterized protein n=1 Tax=Paenibacillus oryzae TaxID=1844972 RepID=A0A1A5YDG9_9BACL|nr:hypothetical protein A7K91_06665 [Paenibacillus oryzae]